MKALFIPFAPSLAHVTRCLSVADTWQKLGNIAYFAIGAERMSLPEEAGYKTYELPEITSNIFQVDRGMKWLTHEYLKKNIAREIEIIEDCKPDVIFYDFRFTSKISGVRASCPTVGIVHGNAILISQAPKIFAQRIIAPGNANEGLKNKFRMAIMRKIFPFAFQIIMRKFASKLNPFLKELSIYPIKSPFDLLFGDHTIIADIPQLIPYGLSGNFHVVGPLLWDGWSRPEPWLDDLDTDPLIYITMGSTVESFSTITKILNALKEQPYNIVVSTGTLKSDFISDLPPKIRVFSYVSGQTVLKRSALVIHHGGHETLMQALAAGTPSLAVPINPDQIMIAKQIEELSFGIYLRKEDAFPMNTNPLGLFSEEDIQLAVKSVINNRKIKMTCEEIGHQFGRCNNVSPLEDFLQMKSFTNYEKGG